jgi:aminoglycoside phosphotransferase (APT) family kinase protein
MEPHNDRFNLKLLTYLRKQLNDGQITFKTEPAQVHGGFETQIYSFQLKGTPEELNHPLVLRLYPEWYGTGNAIWESTIQNVLKEEAFPVAKAYFLCTDLSILGGAFFIMDYLPGKPMVMAPMESVPVLLGKNHALLHQIDPEPLVSAIHAAGLDRDVLFAGFRFEAFKKRASEFPWLRQVVEWLVENRPAEPSQLVICHGDYHPLNILVEDEKVTGVLDWSGFLIGDPAIDIGNTLVLITIPFKHVAPTLGFDFSNVDFQEVADIYLQAYQSEKPVDQTHLDYYQVNRCTNALIEGAQGQPVWQHPPIIRDLLAYIDSITGIRIQLPKP